MHRFSTTGVRTSIQHQAVHRVIEVMVRWLGTVLDEIVFECPQLTWNQVFVIIERLSREGGVHH